MPRQKRETIKEPALRFSPWTPWAERNGVQNAHLPGVYLLALWEDGPPREVDPLDNEIIYIGSITDASLMGRWQQFHRAAFEGKPGHTGGLIYGDTFGDEGEDLYVTAAVTESLPRELRTLFIRYTEQKLIWEWALRWEGPPICNGR